MLYLELQHERLLFPEKQCGEGKKRAIPEELFFYFLFSPCKKDFPLYNIGSADPAFRYHG